MITKNIVDREEVVIKFVGDSGDGMQLTGTLFSDTAALAGNDLATYPDYPSEIRAPHNTVAGVSGFQVHIGSTKIHTSGDLCDVLVAMNPASLKAHLKWAKTGATVIVDADTFEEDIYTKAGYSKNPLGDTTLSAYNLIKAPITSMTREALVGIVPDNKSADKSRNMFALGIVCHLFSWNGEVTQSILAQKFKKKPQVIAANKIVLEAGYSYADTVEALPTLRVQPTEEIKKGRYRNITGNIATAWGFMAASERSGRPIFLGSYPITPATDILQELVKHKSLGVKVFQAEDEIAGICSAIGASYTGSLALTSTSGPGLSLKSKLSDWL
jgi:2-oxoglutarate ferredoxin oxidoreductase subunit alpha